MFPVLLPRTSDIGYSSRRNSLLGGSRSRRPYLCHVSRLDDLIQRTGIRLSPHLPFSIATRPVWGEIPFRTRVLSPCFPVLRVMVHVAADSTMRFRLSNIRSTDPATMLCAVDSCPCPAVRGLHSWACRIARTTTANVYGPRLALRDSVVKERFAVRRFAVSRKPLRALSNFPEPPLDVK